MGGGRSRAHPRLLLATCPPRPLQVHCISTEFTPRKHGGEKGVPFRVQIDTFKQSENGEYTEHLHSASCQIKVFKVGRPRQLHPPSPGPSPCLGRRCQNAEAQQGVRRPHKEPRGSCLGSDEPACLLFSPQTAGLGST